MRTEKARDRRIETQLQGIQAEEQQLLAGDVFLRGVLEHLEHQNTMIIQLLRELLRSKQ